MLLQQLAVVEGHAAVDGFAHVVDVEQGDLHGGYETRPVACVSATRCTRAKEMDSTFCSSFLG